MINKENIKKREPNLKGVSRKTSLKSIAFQKNINNRGKVGLSDKKKRDGGPVVSPYLVGVILAILVGSSIFSIMQKMNQPPL